MGESLSSESHGHELRECAWVWAAPLAKAAYGTGWGESGLSWSEAGWGDPGRPPLSLCSERWSKPGSELGSFARRRWRCSMPGG